MSLYHITYLSCADDSFLFMCTTCVRHTYTASLEQISPICTLILYYCNFLCVASWGWTLLVLHNFPLSHVIPVWRCVCTFIQWYGMDGYNPSLKYFSGVSISDSDQFPFQTGVHCFFMYTKRPLSV